MSRRLRHSRGLAIPKLGDYCIVEMIEEDGTLRQVAVAHRDPSIENRLRSLQSALSADKALDYGVLHVLRTGEPEMCSSVNDDLLMRFCRDYHPALCEEGLAFRSYLIIPLRARGKLLGAITLVNTTDRSYHEAELTLADELAQRAGLALDNAGLYKAAQQARQEAERASRAKDEFLAMLSHELRTPLSPVLSTVALLESEPDTPPSVRDALRMIHRNVTLEARLIDDLLDLTRVSKGKIQLNFEKVDAHALLGSAIEICKAEVDEKQLRVTVRMEATRTFIRADSARLQQIFWNLIKNSVKFTPPAGELTLRTSNEDGHLRVEVTDNGVGIENEMLPKIFNAFEQGARPKAGGLGLGLAITRALVEMHGGRIVAQSEGLGRGATFVVNFETVEAPEHTTLSGGAPETKAGERLSMRLLLVEDHEDTQQSLTRLLQRRGYEVRVAGSLKSALAVAPDYNFDVLISDMGLPDGTGLDLMEKLCQDRSVRGIALSGYGMEEDVQRSRNAGYAEHLTKPVDIHKLDTAIQRVGGAA
jgi:signal transduction histidine kinase